jgi:uncharacterized damage-inducible protein DinB
MILHEQFIDSISKLFERDLRKLESEINLFDNEESLWRIGGEIKNPAGNLALHLCGNLRHYIGHVLGNSGYTRDRENEFAARHVPKSELLTAIRETIDQVSTALTKVNADVLMEEYPVQVFDKPMTTMHFLVHLHGHLNYHLGQINYVRRLTK